MHLTHCLDFYVWLFLLVCRRYTTRSTRYETRGKSICHISILYFFAPVCTGKSAHCRLTEKLDTWVIRCFSVCVYRGGSRISKSGANLFIIWPTAWKWRKLDRKGAARVCQPVTFRDGKRICLLRLFCALFLCDIILFCFYYCLLCQPIVIDKPIIVNWPYSANTVI